MFYFGDEGGVSCNVTLSKDAKEAVIVSLTHLGVIVGILSLPPDHSPAASGVDCGPRRAKENSYGMNL